MEELESPLLNAASAQLEAAVRDATSAMTGVHDTDNGSFAGVEIVFIRLVLGPAPCVQALTEVLTAREAQASSARVYELQSASPEAIDKAFDGWHRVQGANVDPVTGLANAIARHAGGTLLYRTTGDRERAHASGVALVDSNTREALWIFARVVTPIIDRRR